MCMPFRHLVKSFFTPAQVLMKSKSRGEMRWGGLRIKKRRKVKDENVSYLVLEAATLIYSVSSHTSAFTRHFLSPFFSYPLSLSPILFNSPPLFLCFPFVTLVSISRYFSLFLSFIPCSLSPAKNFSCSLLVCSLSSLL